MEKRRSAILALVLTASIALGILTGAGVALADIFPTLNVGWNYIHGTQSQGGGGMGWSYDVDAWEWMKSDKTRVDFDSVHYYNGWADPYYNPTFGDTWIYDMYGYDVTYRIRFSGEHVNGINGTLEAEPDFVMDNLSPSNDYVFVHQYVYYGPGTYADFILAWTNQ